MASQQIDWEKATRAVQDVATAQNVPTSVFPKGTETLPSPQSDKAPEVQGSTSRAAKPTKSSNQPTAPSPTKTFSCVLPTYLIDEIQSRTFHVRPKQTTNYTILKALEGAGFHVRPEDLVPDKRRSRRRAD